MNVISEPNGSVYYDMTGGGIPPYTPKWWSYVNHWIEFAVDDKREPVGVRFGKPPTREDWAVLRIAHPFLWAEFSLEELVP